MPRTTHKEKPVSNKNLYRSATNKVIAGVAGGLGEYFDVDPIIIRIIFILLTIYGGSGILIYFVLWLIIPKEAKPHHDANETIRQNIDDMKKTAKDFAEQMKSNSRQNNSRQIVGIFLLVFGMLILLDNFGIVDFGSVWRFWPVLLIIGGYLVLVRHD